MSERKAVRGKQREERETKKKRKEKRHQGLAHCRVEHLSRDSTEQQQGDEHSATKAKRNIKQGRWRERPSLGVTLIVADGGLGGEIGEEEEEKGSQELAEQADGLTTEPAGLRAGRHGGKGLVPAALESRVRRAHGELGGGGCCVGVGQVD